jgi:hypothetical protein
MQSNNQHTLNASVVEQTNRTIVLKAQEQQKGNTQEKTLNRSTMSTQTVFPGGWIKYRKSGYQGL